MSRSKNSSHREHDEQRTNGTRVANEGNKVQGDDLEEIIPGKGGKERVRRGAETFDIDGEPVTRVGNRNDETGDDDGIENDDIERGVETFDVEGEMQRPTRDDRDNDDMGEPGSRTSGAV